MKIYLYSIFLLLLFLGCSTPKSLYKDDCISVTEYHKREIFKKFEIEEDKYSLLLFTEFFENDEIFVSNEKEALYNGVISTVEGVGLAYVVRIDNNYTTNVYVKNENYSFEIKKGKYKYIYVSKIQKEKKSKYIIAYRNILCGFR